MLSTSAEFRLYSYVVARDFGFAPNPFFGACTLATCKPQIRKHASVGDWIIGTGSAGYGLKGRLVFAMRVAEILTFDTYWKDPKFRRKRPNLRGSLKHAFGDNIYRRHRRSGKWVQSNSHHSYEDGRINQANVLHDTQVDRVLIGSEFIYWGGKGPRIPNRFRGSDTDVCKDGAGHKVRFPARLVGDFISWVRGLEGEAYRGDPVEFARVRRDRAKQKRAS